MWHSSCCQIRSHSIDDSHSDVDYGGVVGVDLRAPERVDEGVGERSSASTGEREERTSSLY